MRWLILLSFISLAAQAQVISGTWTAGLIGSSGSNAGGGAPQTYLARTDTCETGAESGCVANPLCPSCTGTGQPLKYLGPATPGTLPVPGPPGSSITCGLLGNIVQPSNGQYLCGMNSMITDPDFGSTVVRATDYSLASSAACNGIGDSFHLGSSGAVRRWAIDSSKLLIENTGGASSMLAFNPSTMTVMPTRLCGTIVLGAGNFGFSHINPHALYELKSDQENTVPGSVTSGTCLTPEQMKQGGGNASTGTLLAINPSGSMQIGVISGGTPNNTTNWIGQTSGCVFTPSSSYPAPPSGANNTPHATALYLGTINDATQTNPALWTISWSLLFNFNYVVGLGAPYFPTSATSCLPANFNPTWNGVFTFSDDDSTFSSAFSDNGQSSGWDATHVGPVYQAAFTVGSGCRVWNTHTDQTTGDWGPTGQMLDGQHSYVTGAISGTPAIGATLTQDSTGAQTEYMCSGSLVTINGSTQEYTCGLNSPTSWEIGLIYGAAPDGMHAWRDGAGNSLTPTALPVNLPFYYPQALHDSDQTANPTYANVSLAQTPNGKVTQVQGATPSAGQTTITFSNSVHYSADQQVLFYSLKGTHDGYLNCTTANSCPIWTVISGAPVLGGMTLVIADAVNGNGSYSDSESGAVMSPNGMGQNAGYGYFSDPNYWQIPTLMVNVCISPSCQGHQAEGYSGSGLADYYTWHDSANPSLPCSVNGPDTPCPTTAEIKLLATNFPEEQHGTYLNHGDPPNADQTPMAMVATEVCGQASGTGTNTCIQSYASAWESEVVAVENSAANPTAHHCNYGAGANTAACMYRFSHTFNSNDSWDFNQQNGIGTISPDGQWLAWPSSWMNTLGCTNGSTLCWGSYVASGPPASSMTGATIQTDVNGVITVTMKNQFCAPNGSQYYWVNGAVETIPCGALAEQVTLSGFAESWANQTITLTAVGGCDSSDSNAGNCTSFSGTGTDMPASYGPVTETSGTQKATPVNCISGAGTNTTCQRSDIWIVKLASAQQ